MASFCTPQLQPPAPTPTVEDSIPCSPSCAHTPPSPAPVGQAGACVLLAHRPHCVLVAVSLSPFLWVTHILQESSATTTLSPVPWKPPRRGGDPSAWSALSKDLNKDRGGMGAGKPGPSGAEAGSGRSPQLREGGGRAPPPRASPRPSTIAPPLSPVRPAPPPSPRPSAIAPPLSPIRPASPLSPRPSALVSPSTPPRRHRPAPRSAPPRLSALRPAPPPFAPPAPAPRRRGCPHFSLETPQ